MSERIESVKDALRFLEGHIGSNMEAWRVACRLAKAHGLPLPVTIEGGVR